MNPEAIQSLKVGDKFNSWVRLSHIKERELLWTVSRENKSTFTVWASDGDGLLCLYLSKKTGQITR